MSLARNFVSRRSEILEKMVERVLRSTTVKKQLLNYGVWYWQIVDFLQWIIYQAAFLSTGADTLYLNQTRLPVYMTHTPAGTSAQNIVHFGQMVKSKR